MAEDISHHGQEVFISVTPENIKSLNYILGNYLILTLISFCTSISCKNRVHDFTRYGSLLNFSFHFCHLNVNSLLSKIDELRAQRHHKLHKTSDLRYQQQIAPLQMQKNINGNIIIKNDRNRTGGSIACYIRNDLCFNKKHIF